VNISSFFGSICPPMLVGFVRLSPLRSLSSERPLDLFFRPPISPSFFFSPSFSPRSIPFPANSDFPRPMKRLVPRTFLLSALLHLSVCRRPPLFSRPHSTFPSLSAHLSMQHSRTGSKPLSASPPLILFTSAHPSPTHQFATRALARSPPSHSSVLTLPHFHFSVVKGLNVRRPLFCKRPPRSQLPESSISSPVDNFHAGDAS